jgi:hypothetical protein
MRLVFAGTVSALRSGSRHQRVLLAVGALALAVPLLIAVFGIEDRFYDRNVLFLLPVAAALAAPVLLRLRAILLAVYLALAAVTSVWVATNWRYENTDWRGAIARTAAADEHAPLIVVPQSRGEPVAQFYIGHAPATAPSSLAVRGASSNLCAPRTCEPWDPPRYRQR